MKQMVRGAIAILALSGLAACVDDPLLDINGAPNTIQANPNIMLVKQGDSSAVLLRLINEFNNSVPTEFTVSNVGAGISVALDTKYRPEFVDGQDTLSVPAVKSQQRYFVRGLAAGEYTYTVTSQGVSGSFKVRVEPANLGAALSKTTGVAGDEVVINALPGTKFTSTATVAFATGANAIKTRAADGKSITVLVGPGVTGAATVAGVTLDYYPSLPALTLVTTNTMTTPALTAAPTTLSSGTPNTGASVTVALGGSIRFLGNAAVTVGGVEAPIIALSADSSTATVVPALGSSGAVAFSGVALSFLTSVPLTLPSDGKTIVPSATFGGVTLAGADAFATAPEIALPTVVGRTTVMTDNGADWGTPSQCTGAPIGGDNCRFYKIVVPAGQTFTLVGRWNTTADMGFYRFNSAFGAGATIADGLGQSATQSESGTLGANLAAGTYYIANGWYGPNSYGGGAVARPTITQIIIKRTL
ncbi:MAG: hypothetical protein SFU84_12550 [Gemmatimonadales bacterium]|nr:hypothetical protein [Gemmatimonadales bacterium]